MMGCMAAICLLLSSCSTKATPDKVLRHVVMFGFNDNLTEQQVQEIEEAFCALPSQIEEVKGFEWGTDCSPEGLQQGQTHCFFLTFHSDKDSKVFCQECRLILKQEKHNLHYLIPRQRFAARLILLSLGIHRMVYGVYRKRYE